MATETATRPAALTTGSAVTLSAILRSGSGVHADQNRRKNARHDRHTTRHALRNGRYDG